MQDELTTGSSWLDWAVVTFLVNIRTFLERSGRARLRDLIVAAQLSSLLCTSERCYVSWCNSKSVFLTLSYYSLRNKRLQIALSWTENIVSRRRGVFERIELEENCCRVRQVRRTWLGIQASRGMTEAAQYVSRRWRGLGIYKVTGLLVFTLFRS